MPAAWTNGGTHEIDVLVILPTASIVALLPIAYPSRQPLMLYDLLNVYAARHCSMAPGSPRIVRCLPVQTMWQYGSSLNNAIGLPRIMAAIDLRSSAVATPPVGLC